jgi:hypothetical protein
MNHCSIENCMKPIKAKDLCAMHHQRLLRHGDPHTVRPRREKQVPNCKWINCAKISITKGFCAKHYYIQRVLGSSHINITKSDTR